jgi:hypothetical protein
VARGTCPTQKKGKERACGALKKRKRARQAAQNAKEKETVYGFL